MKRYVLGFIFNRNCTKTILIEKQRGPNGQEGKWNGLGGEVEDDEMYVEAMVRKAKTEAGIDSKTLEWVRYATLFGGGDGSYEIACFWMRTEDERLDSAKTMTDEKVQVWSVYPIILAGSLPLVQGVTWLIEMARNSARGDDFWKYYIERGR